MSQSPIKTIEISRLHIPFTQSIKVAIGEVMGTENIIVKITTGSGIVGWGEASPCCPYITGDTADTNYQTAQQLAKLIIGKAAVAIEARMAEINGFIVGEPSIRSAFDMALYDIAAKAANMPLYRFLGGERREIRTDLTIGWQETVEQTVAQAQAILDAGFDAIKMKTGRPGLCDVPHVKAVRELAGPDIAIKIDSNQGWDYPTAIANINAMKHLNLDYSEQPLKVWDYEGLARLRDKVNLPICADESVFTDKDALKLIKQGACDYLNIKLGKAGGIHMGLKINAIAEANGSKCMIGCFGESRLGLSAAAHLAMARPNITFLDLDSAYHFKSDPVIGGVTYDEKVGGLLHLPDTPGHGAEIDEIVLQETIKI
ncbi:mandelate racemase/muconate lactonizing enzyme family protein [Paremcibacter congregatus]|uniref:Dipeptide epimerase n=1 Tax=Paremcibacter congregatus TaxID=2043170 RepID=A0A2G4YVV1_9PROT|nr:dipeptide epimerase [Paremcibacter congregatus]PHZ86370.1 dipeptide epimerase [Paremcibacter congregatus]QDE27984.1 dipeptide epimerase [Paremcibacter congregatus]